MLVDMAVGLLESGIRVFFTGIDKHENFGRAVDKATEESQLEPVTAYSDIDHAMGYAEDCLLEDSRVMDVEDLVVPLEEQPLCQNMTLGELDLLRSSLTEESFNPGDVICEKATAADKLYFLTSGRVSASLKLSDTRIHRLASTAAGTAFGEAALFNDKVRTADIVANTPVSTLSFCPDVLRNSESFTAKLLMSSLLGNLAEITISRLSQANEEIRVLTQ